MLNVVMLFNEKEKMITVVDLSEQSIFYLEERHSGKGPMLILDIDRSGKSINTEFTKFLKQYDCSDQEMNNIIDATIGAIHLALQGYNDIDVGVIEFEQDT